MASELRQRIVVTGGTGLIGRAVLRCLKNAGAEVLTVASSVADGPSSIRIDLSDAQLSLDRLLDTRPDVIVHLAAVVPGTRSPDLLLDAAKTRAIDKLITEYAKARSVPLIYASGCSLYDAADPGWKNEGSPVAADHPYLAAKLDGERLVKECSGVILRISSPYGRGMPSSLVLPRFVGRAARDETIEVWGTGSREQDFIAVEDIADAVKAALKRFRPGVYNIASGSPLTMRQLAELAIKVAGKGRLRVGGCDDVQDGRTARYLTSKAKVELGWTPMFDLGERMQPELLA